METIASTQTITCPFGCSTFRVTNQQIARFGLSIRREEGGRILCLGNLPLLICCQPIDSSKPLVVDGHYHRRLKDGTTEPFASMPAGLKPQFGNSTWVEEAIPPSTKRL